METEAKAAKAGEVKSTAQLHHLYIDLKACIAQIGGAGEMAELHFSIYNKNEKAFVSEPFVVELTHNGMPKDESKIGKLRTLFTDLSNQIVSFFLPVPILNPGIMFPPWFFSS